MSSFVVSARKYRPERFDSVVGQEAVTETLKNAIRSGHLAQAFLFTGPRGVGKTTCARILARTVNCERLNPDLTTCGECASCRTFKEGHSLNIFELDAASNNSVDNIRDLILQVSIAPQVGTKKVYIIDEVHMLSPAAFNAFLKTLEEPPAYAIFILATTEKHKILPTILSRCQVFDFKRITSADIARHLAGIARNEGIEAEPRALHLIAQKADGGLRDALSIFDQLVSFAGSKLTYQAAAKNLNVLDHEHYFSITDSIIKGDAPAALLEFNAILSNGFDGHLFVAGLARHLRDLLVSKDPRTLPLLEVSEDLIARYAEQSKAASRELLYHGLDRLAQCDNQYKLSKEPRLLLELALLHLCRMSAPAQNAPEAEKKSPDLTPAAAPAPVPAIGPGAQKAPDAAETPLGTEGRAPKRRLLRDHISIKPVAPAVVNAPTTPADTDEGPPLPIVAKEVNSALLLRAWTDYAQARKAEGKNSLHATLMAHEPEVTGPSSVRFAIVNDVQEKYMREEKPALLAHLRIALADPALELDVVKRHVEVRPRYTKLDRFTIMAERN
ncbi:MAG: DNA polymerase III subunit gamma/tau, partial [Flavobacteriales bacterium]